VAVNEAETGGGSFGNGAMDRDAPAGALSLPANFRLLR
jgi:hypothetical protein